MDFLRIRGARTHNLKNISLDLPKNKLVVITGPSGSGKSSLAFDTLYAEGQRRYVESLSAYARQFLHLMSKPEVDLIDGLSPAISIEQRNATHNPRSTVGTVTEIHDYLRVLFARAGTPYCPNHNEPLAIHSVHDIMEGIDKFAPQTRLMILVPLPADDALESALTNLQALGFVRIKVGNKLIDMDDLPDDLEKQAAKEGIAVVVDRLTTPVTLRDRLRESLETAILHGQGGLIIFLPDENKQWRFSIRFSCPVCDFTLPELEPKLFSFNSPAGACPKCSGLGVMEYFDPQKVVVNPHQSLAEGAIRGWDRRSSYHHQMLLALAKRDGWDINTAWEKLSTKVRQRVLWGSENENLTFRYLATDQKIHSRTQPFEGIINNLEKRFRETDSQMVREEMMKLRTSSACDACDGTRLRPEARNVRLNNSSLPDICTLPLKDALDFFTAMPALTGQRGMVAQPVLLEIQRRLEFLLNVGLNYLSLERSTATLSGGEAQRIRLASQIGSGLTGVLYVLDEPSIGLHQRDNQRLLSALTHLRDLSNTLIVVEHDEETIRCADYVVDLGPGAGEHGGEVVGAGTLAELLENSHGLTADYLSGRRCIAVPENRRPVDRKRLISIRGASGNNLENLHVDIPVGLMTCVTGVSGSGKSTLIADTLHAVAAAKLNGADTQACAHQSIEGLSHFEKVVNVDQSPIGRTPRSNPATYTGLLTPIRELFSDVPESRARGYGPGRFSFNVTGGRCEHCQGDGLIKIEMHFLADIYVTCDQCQGRRYNRETLEIRYRSANINEVLQMTVEHALEFFQAVPIVKRKLETLRDVGLGYLRLGQSATTLSGGEAQRVKLSLELSRRTNGKTLYILDEPTTGLHFYDISLLLSVLQRLREEGNTVVLIEHNMDVIKTCDWIIDLGPEGGKDGGRLVAEGTPEDVAACAQSHTGVYLAKMLATTSTPTTAANSKKTGKRKAS